VDSIVTDWKGKYLVSQWHVMNAMIADEIAEQLHCKRRRCHVIVDAIDAITAVEQCQAILEEYVHHDTWKDALHD
jgi:hypothetical protein